MTAQPATIDVAWHGPVAHVRLAGELDCSARHELIQTFQELLVVRPLDQVIVDLRPAQFVDSTVLGILVKAERQARLAGVRLVFAKGPPAVQRPFELTHIDRYLMFVQL